MNLVINNKIKNKTKEAKTKLTHLETRNRQATNTLAWKKQKQREIANTCRSGTIIIVWSNIPALTKYLAKHSDKHDLCIISTAAHRQYNRAPHFPETKTNLPSFCNFVKYIYHCNCQWYFTVYSSAYYFSFLKFKVRSKIHWLVCRSNLCSNFSVIYTIYYWFIYFIWIWQLL